MTTVLVTGAGGFVGKSLVRHLNGLGWTVIRGVRSPENENRAASPDALAVHVDENTGHFDIRGQVDAIVHLAGIAHRRVTDPNGYRNANAIWPRRLAERASALGIPRFVFISTVKVAGDSHLEPIDESVPLHPGDAYASSKADAEAMLEQVARQIGLRVTVLRPPLVYGPGVGANFLRLLRIVNAGWPLPLASVRNRRSLVYIGNLVSAIEACLTHPAAANRTFLVSDDHDVSTPELVEEIAASLGKKARLFAFPPVLLRTAGGAIGRGDAMAALTESLQVDISRIKTELGWRPPFSLEQGLAETAVWYRSRRQ